jgi:MFS family permease
LASGRGLFLRLWAALTVALFGVQVSALALPLTAAVWLGATPFQMGLLAAASQAPWLLCSLPLGVWVDRVTRLQLVLIAADLGRACLLGAIPLAALFGVLHFELLCAVVFLVGIFSVAFDVAHYAYVPAVVGRTHLTEANGRIQVSHSAADSAGPGLAGFLVQVVSAPLAVAATAISFFASALLLVGAKAAETYDQTAEQRAGFRSAVMEGLQALIRHPLLRPIVVVSATAGLFIEAIRAVYVLYAARELGLGAAPLGIVLAVGGVAAIPGGLLAGWAARRFGFGPAVIAGWLLEGAALLLVPLAHGPGGAALLATAQAIGGFAGTVANVNQWSLRQVVTPDRLQARVTASHRFLVYGVYPLGALLGGTLAAYIGLRPALLICAVGATLAPLGLLISPVRSLRQMPTADPRATP